ncbi:MAG: arginine--tRNA ligase [SAR202 cluster bacterium]|nr:arginine--tRNA ligase [SAR202 cluster bacterium]
MAIHHEISAIIRQALDEAVKKGLLPEAPVDRITLERPQNAEHGDIATSTPMKLAKPLRMNPMKIAETLAPLIGTDGPVSKAWAARPGFLNMALNPAWTASQVDTIRAAGSDYGRVDAGAGVRMQVEFVSGNPTGPLHVGHARGAVFGSALCSVMEAAGYDIQREYYINDSGNQWELFMKSLWARYLQVCGREAEVPENGYRGGYVTELARAIGEKHGEGFLSMPEAQAMEKVGMLGMQMNIESIRADLDSLRVTFDNWFSERSLYTGGQFKKIMAVLEERGYLSEHDGATWFTSPALMDEDNKNKENVLVRNTGHPTYFASDIAYHYNKFFERKFEKVIDIWGADHHGHVPRVKASAAAIGAPNKALTVLITQLVTLKRGNEVVRVSKRTGDMITLHELVEEVGADACRFVFLSRSADSQMEFDLELAKKQSAENPVYYVQYAHARIAGILRLAAERGIDYSDGDLSLLAHEAEQALIKKMLSLPELIEMMARNLEPHHLPHFAMDLATAFHWFYQQCRVVSSEPGDLPYTKARLKLVDAAKTVLARCLGLMSMSAPEEM